MMNDIVYNRSESFYLDHLQRYYDEKWSSYCETVEFVWDSEPNKWQFIVGELNICVTLACDDGGVIREKVMKLEVR